MPNRDAIALNSIDLVFEAMEEEAHTDLSESLHRYLSVCGKSIGAQLLTGYKIRYYLYSIYFKYLNSSPHQQDYSIAINCIESVLDFAVKAYIDDKKSFREPTI
jgi:hypothetical protein